METAGRRDRIGTTPTAHAHAAGRPTNWVVASKVCACVGGPRHRRERTALRPARDRVAALVSLAGKGAAASSAAARLRHANEMSWFLSGIERMRLPVAAKNALSTAGAATKIVGSPTPPQNPPDGITIDSTLGIWAMRIELLSWKLVCSMRPSLTVHSP